MIHRPNGRDLLVSHAFLLARVLYKGWERRNLVLSHTSYKGALSRFAEGINLLWAQVDVVTPTGKLLARRLSLIIEQGHSVLVTGPNGSGKSSLFRILGGLWPMTSGSIHRPGGSAASADARIFYVPQKPYTTIGTLREQVKLWALDGCSVNLPCLPAGVMGACAADHNIRSCQETSDAQQFWSKHISHVKACAST